ncbi:hypothetical protein [Pseudobdellovibrio exovorus]|uniref:Uncharacterized protein n=1 Tax=Pseudobdellovibrio exovorus JSS TaxID=1184267 RepID=M4V607_9BACT|nr:hypothetical protein [Pseudobdellovibrio exovorus]AGH94613.1 hypothetical protein A11Q_393 [Pseudobdellovibrio exovorus JSS]
MRFGILSFILLLSLSTQAAIYNYDYWWPLELTRYFQQVNRKTQMSPPASTGVAEKCGGIYTQAIAKGEMDVRYALGYFDDTQGKEVHFDGRNYGLSPSLDIAVFHVIRGFMKRPCVNQGQQICEFAESGNPEQGLVVLSKTIFLDQRPVNVKMTLTHASASESFTANKGTLVTRQSQLTRQSEQNFFGALGRADIVFYNGHSRNGGGPDFNPPILNRQNKTNYTGHYEVRRDGIKRFLDLMGQSRNPDQVVGFFSCYSRRHFHRDIMRVNPNQKVILSADEIDYLDSLLASMGYLEGFMQGRCGQDLADFAKQGAKIQNGFQGYNLR